MSPLLQFIDASAQRGDDFSQLANKGGEANHAFGVRSVHVLHPAADLKRCVNPLLR